MLSCPACFSSCEDTHRFCHACGVVLHVPTDGADPLLGRMLPGGYLIRELMAEGAMGRIYRAEQPALERSVAVKMPSNESSLLSRANCANASTTPLTRSRRPSTRLR